MALTALETISQKLQEERDFVMKSTLNKTEIDMKLIKLNQTMIELNSLRNSNIT